MLKYYEIRKARAEAADAEARLRVDQPPPPSSPPGPTGGPRPKSVSTTLTLLPAKTEEEARNHWKLPSGPGDWQLINRGLKMPGRVRRLATLGELDGDGRVEFTCGTGLSWKGPAVRLFGEAVGPPAAVGGFPTRYSGTITRKQVHARRRHLAAAAEVAGAAVEHDHAGDRRRHPEGGGGLKGTMNQRGGGSLC